MVLIPTGPAYGRSPGDPYFDPVWARLAEAGVVVAFHIMPFWYFDNISPAWGLDTDPASWHMSAWQWNNIYGERPIMDTLSALIFDKHMDKSRGMGRNGPWIGGPLTERPSAIFREHIRVAPYPEDDIPDIVDRLGHADSLVMGSDWPHAEGLAVPADFEKLLAPLDQDPIDRIMHRTAEALLAR